MKPVSTHKYCPVCGHDLNAVGNDYYINNGRKLLEDRSAHTQKRIRNLFVAIQKVQRDEINAWTQYKFLKRLVPIKDEIIKRVISQFIGGDYHKKLYGLTYITAWIERLDKIKDKKRAVEKKIYGSSPLDRTHEIEVSEPIKMKPFVGQKTTSPALDRLRKSVRPGEQSSLF